MDQSPYGDPGEGLTPQSSSPANSVTPLACQATDPQIGCAPTEKGLCPVIGTGRDKQG